MREGLLIQTSIRVYNQVFIHSNGVMFEHSRTREKPFFTSTTEDTLHDESDCAHNPGLLPRQLPGVAMQSFAVQIGIKTTQNGWNRTCKPHEYVICSSMFTLGPHIVDVFIFYFYSVICLVLLFAI